MRHLAIPVLFSMLVPAAAGCSDSSKGAANTAAVDGGSGGADAGGNSPGGANAGGSSSGGANAGGSSSGGANSGGKNSGGASAGGSGGTDAGADAGGSSGGGANAGGSSSGGASAGGSGGTDAGADAGGSNDASTKQKVTLAVIGDVPYGGSPTDTAEFNKNPDFVTAINGDTDVSLVLHAGDIHSGKQYCTEAYDRAIRDQWVAFKVPVIYTPGDNEWSDCHKAKEGGGTYNTVTGQIDYLSVVGDAGTFLDYAGGNPVANLDLVRSIFFANPGKAFGGTLDVHTQAQEHASSQPTDGHYVENVWLEQAGALIVTVNMPGGSNDDADPWYGAPSRSPEQQQEVTNRRLATMHWLDAAFQHATDNGDDAVLIMLQADMWDLDGKLPTAEHLTEYKRYIDKIAALTTTFGKPVLLINGDSHFYRSDNPLVNAAACKVEVPSTPIGTKSTVTTTCADSVANGALKGLTGADPYGLVQVKGDPTYLPTYNVPNFHRIVVHGNATVSATDLEYIKLTIDPSADAPASESAFGPFAWARIQPMN